MMKQPVVGSYRDADGARHELAVRETAEGDWQVLDTGADGVRVIDTLAATRTAARRQRRSPATT